MSHEAESINNFPYWYQGDFNESYGGGTIAGKGCGVTAAAMILKSYGIDTTPVEAAKYSDANGHYVPGEGTGYSLYPAICSKYGLSCEELGSSMSAASERLKKGIPLIYSVHQGVFTGGGHVIAMVGITGDGHYLINDPNSRDKSRKKWSYDTISANLLQFFAISKDGQGSIGRGFKASDGTNWTEREVPNIGQGLATKSYMAYQAITAKGTKQYELSYSSNASTHSGGLRVYNGKYYMIAMGTYYGKCGTYVKIRFDDDKEIQCIIGDLKKDSETDAKHQYHKSMDGSVLEFIVDGGKVTGNEQFNRALQAADIKRSSRIVKIWTSDTAPSSGSGNGGGEKEYHFADTNEKQPLHARLFQAPTYYDAAAKQEILIMANQYDITPAVGNLQWQNTLDELATTMTFDVGKTDAQYTSVYLPSAGDIIEYYTAGTERFRGQILVVDDGADDKNSYTAVDAGTNLNQSTDTYQFTDVRADEAIRKICGDLAIPVVMLPELTQKITQIYIDKGISDIIKDILSQCGEYNLDFVPEGIRIYPYGAILTDPEFQLSPNTQPLRSTAFRGRGSHSVSLMETKTSVKVISDTDVLYRVQNDSMTAQLGFRQEVIQIDPEKENAAEIAKKKLNELSRGQETFSFPCLESLTGYTRAGYRIREEGIDYLITSAQHTVQDSVHHVQAELRRMPL